jgi:hypothetical protein
MICAVWIDEKYMYDNGNINCLFLFVDVQSSQQSAQKHTGMHKEKVGLCWSCKNSVSLAYQKRRRSEEGKGACEMVSLEAFPSV